MPPWNYLRVDKDKDSKRRTVIGPSSTQNEHGSQEQTTTDGQDGSRETTPTSPRRNRRLRDSVVSLGSAPSSPPLNPPARPIPSLELPVEERRDVAPIRKRLSMLKYRHASDSELSKTAKEHASTPPAVPAGPPSIITTAPTTDNLEANKRKSAFFLPRRNKTPTKKKSRQSLFEPEAANDDARTPTSRVTFDEGSRLRTTQSTPAPPPAYGDEYSSALALPISRMSESSRSDGSSGDHRVYATTTTTHTISTTTTFFRLPRRKKDKGHLFPLPPKVTASTGSLGGGVPRLSTSGLDAGSPSQSYGGFGSETSSIHGSPRKSGQQSPTRSGILKDPFRRSDSRASANSRASSTKGRPSTLTERGRSSTMSSLRNAYDEGEAEPPVPPLPQSTRTSTSTAGRPSLGGLFNLTRLRHGTDMSSLTPSGPGTPGSMTSKQNSFNLTREPEVIIPERQEGDTPAKYLARLEEVITRSRLVAHLAKHDDEFTRNVLRSYMRRFKLYEDPLDMAVRKMLMQVDLPKETQQIDRTVQSFADRYHECNPGIFPTPDDAYFVAFSILMLHTDVFNKNNKNKMQKHDYVKNTRTQGGTIAEVLECFYDNISYTPFIHIDDDMDFSTEQLHKTTSKKSALKNSASPLKKGHSGPIDPYTLLMESKLSTLRPDLEDILPYEDSFNYFTGEATSRLVEINHKHQRQGIIQIMSSRSRPGAFANQATIMNPLEAPSGIVEIKVTKVGILWRKDLKKKKTRSPWQDWGAILTGSQLYFFRNTPWWKDIHRQYEQHFKHGRHDTPVVFKPPLPEFKPDFVVSIDNAVALIDSTYKKHKNAFVFTRQNSFAEVFLADDYHELKDWLAKLNYSATYRTSGVLRRDVAGNSYETKRQDNQRDTSADIEVEQPDLNINGHNVQDVEAKRQLDARHQLMSHQISQADEKLQELDQRLDTMSRAGRQLKILAPIQQKTRLGVRSAAEELAHFTRVTYMERWKVRCHRDILAMELDEEQKVNHPQRSNTEESQKDLTPQNTKEAHQSRSPFGRLNSKNNDSRSSSTKGRPGAQKLFSMDEIFRTPSRLKQGGLHRAKGSWELPPLKFQERRGSDANKPEVKAVDEQAVETSDDEETYLTVPSTPMQLTRNSSEADITSERDEEDEKEREVLAEAGVVPPDAEPVDDSATDAPSVENKDTENEKEKDKDKDHVDDKDGLKKVRHSLQKKLQGGHTPNHQRSRKGKDSVSSTGGSTDDGTTSAAENEQLTRSGGVFTVHGKKASIVNFGSEWENMTPEERIKRSRPHSGTVTGAGRLPSATENGSIAGEETEGSKRKASVASSEVETIKSISSKQQQKDRTQSDASTEPPKLNV